MTSTARQNVRGNNGPDRRDLPNYKKFGAIDWVEFDALKYVTEFILNEIGPEHNDINNAEAYQIAQGCPLKTYFPPTYRQVLLQQPLTHGAEEEDYRAVVRFPKDAGLKIFSILRQFGLRDFYRARLAILPPGAVLDWHIDTNTSVSCRVQIPIIGDCRWEIKRNNEIEQQFLRPSEIWFTNTGYAHRVKNIHHTEDRVCLVIGCHYDAIKKWFE